MAPKKKEAPKKLNFIEAIAKDMGDKDLMVMDSKNAESLIPWRVPFKHLGLQKATGGLLGGKMMEIQGDSQSGKSFLLYELMASAIEMGGACYLCDAEQAFEPAYGEKMGITGGFMYSADTEITTVFNQITTFLESARKHIKGRDIPLLVGIDSFAALRTKDQMKADEAGKDPSGFASSRKNIQFYDKLTMLQPLLTEYSASLVVLNQLRTNHTIMFGDKTTSLAETMKYYMTQRLRGQLSTPLYKIIKVDGKDTKVQVGMSVNWKTIKNRFVEPFKKVKVETLFSSGMKPTSGLLTFLLHEQEIEAFDRPIINKDGKEGKKMEKAFKIPGYEKTYSLSEARLMIEENPFLLEPAYTKLTNEIAEYEEGAEEEAVLDGEE